MVFPAELARGLFGHLVSAVSGTSQYRRASFLLDAEGERIFPEFMDIREDPFIPRAMGSAAFDDEGVRRGAEPWWRRASSRAMSCRVTRRDGWGGKTTGNAGGVHNLIVRANGGSLETLLGECADLFLVGELLGQGVNTVTATTRGGLPGSGLEGGAVAYPVHEATVAGNLKEIFKGIRRGGSDVDLRGGIRCGSVLVDGLTLAGT